MLRRGERIGKYLIKDTLGRGGMGVVYLAVQEGLEREVALKVLPEKGLEHNELLRRRFLKEASVCARLSHPNIVKVYDFGYEGEACYYAMEVLRATSLEQVLEKQRVPPFEFTLRVAREMASAFEYFHAQAIVHRDIKPANIMLASDDRAILMDFGLVKELDATRITEEGVTVGTPYFMAPEMLRGKTADAASDIYQLGIVLYRMLAGELPFTGNAPRDVFKAILQVEARPPSASNPAVPKPLDNLVLNCIEKDKAHRYRSAQELSADLRLVAGGAAVARRRDAPSIAATPRPATPADGEPRADDAAAGTGGQPPARDGRVQAQREGSRAGVPAGSGPRSGPGGSVSAARIATWSRAVPRAAAPAPEDAKVAGASRSFAGAALRAALLLLPAALGLSWLLERPAAFSAVDVECRTGVRRAIVEWRSPAPYAGRIDWSEVGSRTLTGPPRIALSELGAGQRHRVALAPLVCDRGYRYCILFPDGQRSLEYHFRTPPAPVAIEALTVSSGVLELDFTTPAPAVATLRSGPQSVSTQPPRTSHRTGLKGFDPVSGRLALELRDAAGDEVRLDHEQLVELARQTLLPKLVPRLTAALASYDPVPFLKNDVDRLLPPSACSGALSGISKTGLDGLVAGKKSDGMPRYQPFADGDAVASGLAASMRRHLGSLPFAGDLSAMLLLGPGLLENRRLTAEQTSSLYAGLRKLRALDHYARFLHIPFSSGVEHLFEKDYRVRHAPAIALGPQALEHAIPGGECWAHPIDDYLLLARTGIDEFSVHPLGAHEWRFALREPSRCKRAELTAFELRLEPELVFRVTLNGKLTLDFRSDPARTFEHKNDLLPSVSMTFDPRFLRPGENLVRIELDGAAGTRYLGLKSRNRLSRLRLAWE
ncbi:MAG: serine/threonine protein kinase [Candidatus Riflebacteria bacterium]|nr:serine/threonine protein kinase [Candidatus Riflebacteria bacterium]